MKKILFLLCLLFAFKAVAQHNTPAPSAIDPQLLTQDLETLYQQLQSNHPKLFAYRSKAEGDKHFNQIKQSINRPMERQEFHRLIAPFIASFRDGHTFVDINFEDEDFTRYAKSGGTFFPIQVVIISNKLYCISNPFNRGNLQRGDEIISINEEPVSSILPKLRSLMSSDGDEPANANVQRLFSYLFWLNGHQSPSFSLRYASGDNIQQEELQGITSEQLMHLLFKPKGPVRQLHLYPEQSLAVVEINNYGQVKQANIFIDSCFQVIKNMGLKNVALDLRKNGGGSSSIGAYFLAHITKKPTNSTIQKSWRLGPLVQALGSTHWIKRELTRVENSYSREDDYLHSPIYKPSAISQLQDSSLFVPVRFFLLTSAQTYSSAHMTALSVKCGELGTIIGQATGERLDLTGELLSFQLPHSRLNILVPVASYKSACGDGTQVGVAPDFTIIPRAEDLQLGRDPEIDFLKNLVLQKN